MEAYLRTLFDKDPKAYENEVKRIRRAQRQYEKDHSFLAGLGELGGAVGTAFVPGLQGLSAAKLANMGRLGRGAHDAGVATLQGMAYGRGSMYDDPDSGRDPLAVLVSETLGGTGGYGAVKAGQAGYRRLPQGVRDFVARQAGKVGDAFRVRRPARR
jgi:hypothetical protein